MLNFTFKDTTEITIRNPVHNYQKYIFFIKNSIKNYVLK